MIGLLKYSLLKDEEDGELIGASSGLTLSDLVKKIHDKQLELIEERMNTEGKSWPQIVVEALDKFKAPK